MSSSRAMDAVPALPGRRRPGRGGRLCRAIAGGAMLVALSGCASWFAGACAKPGDFAAAQDNAPLKLPPGATAPDTRAAMPIPALNEPERVRSAADACLDTPPRYAAPRETQPKDGEGKPVPPQAVAPRESRPAA